MDEPGGAGAGGAVAPAPGAPVGQLDNRLLASQAKTEILSAILDGRFQSKLPSEDKLAAMLNISRTTVRTALQSLERDGVVTRQRAIGTLISPHVNSSSLALQRLAGFEGLLEERGHEVRVELTWEWAKPDDLLRDAFSLVPDEDHLTVAKDFHADGALAISVREAIPRSSLEGGEVPPSIDSSLAAFSERAFEAPIHHAVVKLVPDVKRGPNTRLAIDEGAPFMRLLEVHYSARCEALAYSVTSTDDNYVSLEVARTR